MNRICNDSRKGGDVRPRINLPFPLFPLSTSVSSFDTVREKTLAAIKPDAIDHKESIMSNIRDSGFHIVAEKKLALTKEIAEEFYTVRQLVRRRLYNSRENKSGLIRMCSYVDSF